MNPTTVFRAMSNFHVALCQESLKDAEEITGVSSRRGSAFRLNPSSQRALYHPFD